MEGDWTWGGEHTVQYTEGALQNCTPDTSLTLFTGVTPTESA